MCFLLYIIKMVINMPLFTKEGLAANQILKNEHIQIIEESDLSSNLLEIGILNLMPKKEDTEMKKKEINLRLHLLM